VPKVYVKTSLKVQNGLGDVNGVIHQNVQKIKANY